MNPYAPPPPPQSVYASPGSNVPGAYRIGNNVALPRESHLPPLCAKCAREDGIALRDHRFGHTPALIFILAFVFLPAAVLLLPRERQTANVALFLCGPCATKWRIASIAFWLAVAISFLGVLGMVYTHFVDEPGWLPLLVIGALIGGIGTVFLLYFTVVQRTALRATSIDKTHVWIAGFHPRVANLLAPPWGGSR